MRPGYWDHSLLLLQLLRRNYWLYYSEKLADSPVKKQCLPGSQQLASEGPNVRRQAAAAVRSQQHQHTVPDVLLVYREHHTGVLAGPSSVSAYPGVPSRPFPLILWPDCLFQKRLARQSHVKS